MNANNDPKEREAKKKLLADKKAELLRQEEEFSRLEEEIEDLESELERTAEGYTSPPIEPGGTYFALCYDREIGENVPSVAFPTAGVEYETHYPFFVVRGVMRSRFLTSRPLLNPSQSSYGTPYKDPQRVVVVPVELLAEYADAASAARDWAAKVGLTMDAEALKEAMLKAPQ